MKLCIVIPAHNEEAVLEHTHKELCKTLHALMDRGEISRNSFLCFVDDGSKDRTWDILCSLSKDSQSIDSKNIESKQGGITTKALKLSRNCGHQNALLAGLEYVADKCDCAISIDCDLQDDISVFDEFVAKAKMGAEVIYGVRKSRQKDSFFKDCFQTGLLRLC